MRILLTSPSMQAGGAEQVVTTLAAALVDRGHEVALAAPPGVRDGDLRGVPHTRLRIDDHGRAALGAGRSALQLASGILRFSPDVVHAQNVKSSVTARAAALAARPLGRAPVLATFHGVLPVEYRRAAQLLHAADHVACVSSDLRESIVAAGLGEGRASLVRNAVSPAPAAEEGERSALDAELGTAGAPVVAIVGRLVPQKAHERFVAAAAIVAAELPEARFLILGDGPRRAEIEAMVAAAGLDDRVRLTGVRDDARRVMARADAVVFSSEWEGLSIAALESLAAGTPVISTDVQGMRGLLVESGAGAVVPLDDGTALGERLLAFLRDPAEREAMGAAARELIASEYSADGMVEAYEGLYERLRRDGAAR